MVAGTGGAACASTVVAEPEAVPGEIDARIAAWLDEGASPRDAARRLAAETGLGRRVAYQRVLSIAARGPVQ